MLGSSYRICLAMYAIPNIIYLPIKNKIMAKTKEEIIQYLKTRNWGSMWINNIHLHATCVVPNNLDGHLDKMFSHYSLHLSRWIICNAVSISNTPQGELYWRMVQNEWERWYNS